MIRERLSKPVITFESFLNDPLILLPSGARYPDNLSQNEMKGGRLLRAHWALGEYAKSRSDKHTETVFIVGTRRIGKTSLVVSLESCLSPSEILSFHYLDVFSFNSERGVRGEKGWSVGEQKLDVHNSLRAAQLFLTRLVQLDDDRCPLKIADTPGTRPINLVKWDYSFYLNAIRHIIPVGRSSTEILRQATPISLL